MVDGRKLFTEMQEIELREFERFNGNLLFEYIAPTKECADIKGIHIHFSIFLLLLSFIQSNKLYLKTVVCMQKMDIYIILCVFSSLKTNKCKQ